jgi:putative spermidine/putrescine transport system ATP-binding protein
MAESQQLMPKPRAAARTPPAAGARQAVSLSLKDVSKRYGGAVAVQPLSLEIRAGELLALLGPSGCGKTTTLRMIAGFETPDTGAVIVGERDITFEPPNVRRLGMVFQNYSLFPHMTVAENVAFGLRMQGRSRSEIGERVDKMLETVQLSGFGERYPSQMSGGQQQRVALARALVVDPSVLLLDEPLGALDKNLREGMQFELRQLQKSLGITSVLVTHDQEEALTMADRIAVMSAGVILQVGTPTEVYDRPRTRFVSEFLGTSNVFEAKIEQRKNGQVAVDMNVGRHAHRTVLSMQGDVDASQQVLVAVRPERIRLGRQSETANGVPAIAARVIDQVFRGSSHAYKLSVDGRAEPIISYRQADSESSSFEAGEEVFVSWTPDAPVLLEDRL